MKINLIASTLTLTAVALVTSTAQANEVEYRGDPRATAICKAIVEDNPKALKTELRKAARDDRNLRFTATTTKSFQCNGQTLDKFAADTGAGKTMAWLENSSTAKTVAQN